MIEVAEGVFVGIADNVSLSDIVNNPQRHHWKVGWRFTNKHRDRYWTPTGKPYGTSDTFKKIYESLNDDFIGVYFDDFFLYSDVAEQGEDFLEDLNSELRVTVTSYQSSTGDVRDFERSRDINATRAQRAQDRFETHWEKANERIDDINSQIDYLVSVARLTRSGNIDMRTREAKLIGALKREKAAIWAESDRLERNMNREQTRLSNSQVRYREAMDKLRRLQNNLDIFEDKYSEKAKEFAKMIKEDIISKGRSGELPSQNLPLMERTIRNRFYAGIPETPRFWATGQLIRSIQITCQLV